MKGMRKPIFSTRVEMNRPFFGSMDEAMNFLHACGDEPSSRLLTKITGEFSPRVWR